MVDDGLSDADARELEGWILAATGWGEASQAAVAASTALATASRDIATRFDGRVIATAETEPGDDGEPLTASLRALADAIEGETADLRSGYMATAACLETCRGILD